jgi:molybdopterin-guanine dinucleotide biosynthesis protein A
MPRSSESCTVHPRTTFAAVILAGGASMRMGTDKAYLVWQGAPLIRRQIEIARVAGAAQVWIAGRRDTDYSVTQCPVVHDPLEGAGPLAGMVAALRAVASSHNWLLALAVDLPQMTSEYLGQLAAVAAATGHGVIPQRGPYFEPLAAIYPVAPTLAVAEAHLAARRLALQDLAAVLFSQGAIQPQPITSAERGLFANWNDSAGPAALPAN